MATDVLSGTTRLRLHFSTTPVAEALPSPVANAHISNAVLQELATVLGEPVEPSRPLGLRGWVHTHAAAAQVNRLVTELPSNCFAHAACELEVIATRISDTLGAYKKSRD